MSLLVPWLGYPGNPHNADAEVADLRAKLAAADLDRIRLRAALIECITEVEHHAQEYQHVTPREKLADWKALVQS